MIEQEDHRKEGLKRIGHQYAHSEKFWQFVEATLEPLNNIEAVFLSLLAIDLDTASGVVLDLLGRIVGAPSLIPDAIPIPLFGFDDQEEALAFGELDDPDVGGHWRELDDSGASAYALDEDQYRLAIKVQILKNSSDCTPDNIIEIIKLLTSAQFAYIDGQMWIGIGLSKVNPMTLLEIRLIEMFIPKPAGVRLRFFYNWFESFGWSDQLDSLGFGELDDPNVGGHWIEEIY